ncbi:SMI1/KNR4 family protein [Streptomyces flaveus]|uniref:SMI1/KNR4 family protein n=1 Tax=Streptomyces flaveus TaxID=66370 RepID=UPI00331E9CB7
MSDAVIRAFGRIDMWLERNAPLSYQSLQPPATDSEIVAAENELGLTFPDDLRTLLRLHNGVAAETAEIEEDEEGEVANTKFLKNQALLSLDQIVYQYRRLTDPNIGSSDRQGYLPWLAPEPADMMSCWLVSARQENTGALARWDEYSPLATVGSGPQTIGALLDAHADALESGTGPLFGPGGDVPGLVYGCLVWDDPDHPSLYDSEAWTPLR